MLDHTVRRLKRGEASAIDMINALLAQELTLHESRRIETALMMARLVAVDKLISPDIGATHSHYRSSWQDAVPSCSTRKTIVRTHGR